jgi:hypothetical protein
MDIRVDEVLLLAPVLALAVVLLLGFAGCKFEPGAAAATGLSIRIRVPSALVVTQAVFGWESPSTPRDQRVVDNPSPAFVDGADNVFTQSVDLTFDENGMPIAESWTVRGQVTVQGGAIPGPSASGMFTLDGSNAAPIATFQATGGAADLALTFVGQT